MNQVQHISGGNIVTPQGIIYNGTVSIENGRIVDIQPFPRTVRGASDVDAAGLWVLPGIVDSHSDAIEHEMQPRPASRFPIEPAYYELERKLVSQGVTTIYHSLSMLGDNANNDNRRNASVQSFVSNIGRLRKERHLIHHKLHIRYDITNLEAIPFVEAFLENREIEQLSFMDHTPGQGQYRNMELQKRFIMERQNKSEEEVMKILDERINRPKADASVLRKLAELAVSKGIPVASHDDDSIQKLDLVNEWNAVISEFPIIMEVAVEAKRRGMYVVMGAPNVMLGRSHSNNLSAQEAIEAGVVDILCSDYYPPALLQAVYLLHSRGHDLTQMVNMVSLNPAKALGIADYTGSIECGKAADLLLVRDISGRPVIQTVLVEGEIVCRMDYKSSKHHGAGKGVERVEA